MAAAAGEEALSVRRALLAALLVLAPIVARAQIWNEVEKAPLTDAGRAKVMRALHRDARALSLDLASLDAASQRSRLRGRSFTRWHVRAQVWSRPTRDPAGFCRATQYSYDERGDTGRLERDAYPMRAAWADAGGDCGQRPADTVQVSDDAAAPLVARILREQASLLAQVVTLPVNEPCKAVAARSRLVAIEGRVGEWELPADPGRATLTYVTLDPERSGEVSEHVLVQSGTERVEVRKTSCWIV